MIGDMWGVAVVKRAGDLLTNPIVFKSGLVWCAQLHTCDGECSTLSVQEG